MDTHKFYNLLLKKGRISKNQAIMRMNREQDVILGIYDSVPNEKFLKEAVRQAGDFEGKKSNIFNKNIDNKVEFQRK